MANIKSQIKRNRTRTTGGAEKNKAVRTALKTSTKKVRTAVAEGDAEAAAWSCREAARALDKAARRAWSTSAPPPGASAAWPRPPTLAAPRR